MSIQAQQDIMLYSYPSMKCLHTFYSGYYSLKYFKRYMRVMFVFLNIGILEAILSSLMIDKYNNNDKIDKRDDEDDGDDKMKKDGKMNRSDAQIFFLSIILYQFFSLLPPIFVFIGSLCCGCVSNAQERIVPVIKYLIIVLGIIICMMTVRENLVHMISKASGIFVGLLFGLLLVEYLILEPICIFIVMKCKSFTLVRLIYFKKLSSVWSYLIWIKLLFIYNFI